MTDRQKKFIREYCKYLNASRAARNAGYSIRCAAQIGYENMRKPKVRAPIDEYLEIRRREIDRILQERHRQGLISFYKTLEKMRTIK
ncbi:terminase small subunit [Parapedobacter soli]|uniref:terminase small subunit n=1 Tax=Parapedobacter soli TaxID=416955 RepID=UPI0021C6E8DA|nr:terminase small subunit [Parapedobacter soli]